MWLSQNGRGNCGSVRFDPVLFDPRTTRDDLENAGLNWRPTAIDDEFSLGRYGLRAAASLSGVIDCNQGRPALPKTPTPSLRCSPTHTSMSLVLAMKEPLRTMNWSAAEI
jgi:hypothetical protein